MNIRMAEDLWRSPLIWLCVRVAETAGRGGLSDEEDAALDAHRRYLLLSHVPKGQTVTSFFFVGI